MPQPAPHTGGQWIRDETDAAHVAAFEALGRSLANVECVLDGPTMLHAIGLICSPKTRPFVSIELLDWARSNLDALDLTDHERDQLAHILGLVPRRSPAELPIPSPFQDPTQ